MSEIAYRFAGGRVADRTRPSRLPPGVGLAVGAGLSLALWAGLALLAARLLG